MIFYNFYVFYANFVFAPKFKNFMIFYDFMTSGTPVYYTLESKTKKKLFNKAPRLM